MRTILCLWTCALAWAPATFAGEQPRSPQQDREGRPCVECHQAIVLAFGETRMAQAAVGTEFLAEWNGKDRPAYCMSCHAPSGGKGLGCADCHGTGPHPYLKLEAPGVCAACHDAPGESTVRRFLAGPAARRGKNCLDCHLPGTAPELDHRFQGPSVAGFLDQVAKVRILLRREPSSGTTAVIQVTHRAGHALPGGTTGRSVWLVAKGLKSDGTEAWTEHVRFGWEHDPEEGWVDRTLLPGRGAVIELPWPEGDGAVKLRAELLYRFRPGGLEVPDPRAVLLDRIELVLR